MILQVVAAAQHASALALLQCVFLVAISSEEANRRMALEWPSGHNGGA
jgi:hypothetical protein